MSEALEWSIDRGALALWRTRFDAIYDCRPCRRTLFLRCGALTNFLISRKMMVLCRSRNWPAWPDNLCRLREEISMATGTVKFFNSTKGFGFIEQGNGQPDVFVHISAVERAGMRSLVEGQKLSFDIVSDRRGKSSADNLQAG